MAKQNAASVELTAEEILGASNSTVVPVDLSDIWPGKSAYVRVIDGFERDRYEASLFHWGPKGQRTPNLENARGKLCVVAWSDSTGKRLFQDSQAAAVGKTDSRVLDRVYDAARKLNLLDEESEALDAKNSDPAPSSSSGTA